MYDYQALVNRISKARKDHDLQSAAEAFDELSKCCPMTPLLWMQYASTAKALASIDESLALQLQLQTLQLGLEEFPGHALLNYHYVALVRQHGTPEEIESALEEAIGRVGLGSHRNEGPLIVALFRWQAEFYAQNDMKEKAVASILARAGIPLGPENDTLAQEASEFCQQHQIELFAERIDDQRRKEAKNFSDSALYEDSIDAVMNAEGILVRHEPQSINWDSLLESENQTFGMGLGGMQTAKSFVTYALAYRDSGSSALVQAIFERGIAESPTVESLWQAYIKYLLDAPSREEELNGNFVQSVTRRAFRNCPYSLALVKLRMQAFFVLSMHEKAVFDPDTLSSIGQEALQMGFLPGPNNYIEIRLFVIRLTKQYILFCLSGEVKPTKSSKRAYDDQLQQQERLDDIDLDAGEIKDLCEDLSELYSEIDVDIQKNYSSWTGCRAILYNDEARTRELMLDPLNGVRGGSCGKKALKAFEKAMKVCNPPHPDDFLNYIQKFSQNYELKDQKSVLQRILHVRDLFDKGLRTFGRRKESFTLKRSFDAALTNYVHEWLDFESCFGSERSSERVSKIVDKKMTKVQFVDVGVHKESTQDREGGVDHSQSNEIEEDGVANQNETHNAHGVSEGHLESKTIADRKTSGRPEVDYKAHPFTVKVSNLSGSTEDMDLVELLRQKVGRVSHVRIIREKQGHVAGSSKGWALAQFEERESVTKALELNDILGLHEKILSIEPSHTSAVPLVPPGRERTKPKGEGKYSRRNEKRKRHDSKDEGGASGKSDEKTTPEKSSTVKSALFLVPRGIKKKARVKM